MRIDPTARAVMGMLSVLITLCGCTPRPQVDVGHVENVEIEAIDPGGGWVRIKIAPRRDYAGETEVRDTLFADQVEVIRNGGVARLSDLRPGDRITAHVRSERSGESVRRYALKILVRDVGDR